MVFLSPVAALVALAVAVPLAAWVLFELRARRVASRIGLLDAPRPRLGVPVALVLLAALLGIAAAQPVVSSNKKRVGRADAEVYLLFDTSRSMLAKRRFDDASRLTRAKRLGIEVRGSLRDVPVGLASLTDRVLPHLFPTLDAQVFASTLRDAIAIERPPPAGDNELATDYTTLSSVASDNYFKPTTRKRLLIVFSDGESRGFDDVVLAGTFRRHHVRVLFVHIWNAREQIFLTRTSPDPAYRPDPTSKDTAERLAQAGGGMVLPPDRGAIVAAARAFLGKGPAISVTEQRTRTSLAPYVVLAALLPLSFVLFRRNL